MLNEIHVFLKSWPLLNSNIEIRNSKQILNPNVPMIKTMDTLIFKTVICFGHLNFGNSKLFRVSCFGFIDLFSAKKYLNISFMNFIKK